MHAKRRAALQLPQLIALVLLSATFVGCAGKDQCFPDGHCIAMPGYFGFYAQWAGAIFLGCVALFGVFVTSGVIKGNTSAGCLVGFVTLTIAVAGWRLSPGTTSPRARAEEEVRQYGERLQQMARDTETGRILFAKKAEEQKRLEATPKYQLSTAQSAYAALQTRRDEMQKTRTKWQGEFDGLRRDLQRDLRKTGARSHQELITRKDISQQTLNHLNRAAHLRVLVTELDALLGSAGRTLIELDQQIWKLEKMVELNNVTTEEESQAIRRALASATELVRERTSPVKREDIAVEEARLFRELMGGAR